MIGTTRHNRGLYLLDNDAFSSSISRTSLLSSQPIETQFNTKITTPKLNNIESCFTRNPISQPDLLLLSIVIFGDHRRSLRSLGNDGL